MLNSTARNHRMAIPALACGIFCDEWEGFDRCTNYTFPEQLNKSTAFTVLHSACPKGSLLDINVNTIRGDIMGSWNTKYIEGPGVYTKFSGRLSEEPFCWLILVRNTNKVGIDERTTLSVEPWGRWPGSSSSVELTQTHFGAVSRPWAAIWAGGDLTWHRIDSSIIAHLVNFYTVGGVAKSMMPITPFILV